jgi:AbrB family looped-hinge helix DNA binding protein
MGVGRKKEIIQTTLSSKGQIVLPAPMRLALGLRARSKVLIEERDGGIFISPARGSRAIAPIDYFSPGANKLTEHDYVLDAIAGEDDTPYRRSRNVSNPVILGVVNQP